MKLFLAALAVCLGSAFLSPGIARAGSDDALRSKIEKLTAPLIERLKEREAGKEFSVALKEPLFDPPKDLRTTGGSVLRDHVQAVLVSRQVKLDAGGRYRLRGSFRMKTMNASEGAVPYAVVIQMSLLNERDEPIGDPSAENIQDPEVIVPLLGATGRIPPTGRERMVRLAEAVNRASFSLDDNGTVVRAAKGSKYGVEFLVGSSGGPCVPRKIQNIDNMPFVALKAGEVYQLRIHNDSDAEAAVEVRIDGRNVFQRAVDPKDRTMEHWCIGKRFKAPINGWYTSRDGYDEFKIEKIDPKKPLPAGVSVGDLGMVTLQFHQTWDPKSNGPADDLVGGRVAKLPDQEVMTGAGAAVKQDFKFVNRVTGGAREFITIRYNSRGE